MDKVIVYKNRVEVKILSIVYAVIFIPVSILIIISSFKDPSILVTFFLILLFVLIVLIIDRFRIIFDFKNRKIFYRSYFTLTRVFDFDEVKAVCIKANDSIPDSFDYVFYKDDKKIFKINSINFVHQSKECIDYLNKFI